MALPKTSIGLCGVCDVFVLSEYERLLLDEYLCSQLATFSNNTWETQLNLLKARPDTQVSERISYVS